MAANNSEMVIISTYFSSVFTDVHCSPELPISLVTFNDVDVYEVWCLHVKQLIAVYHKNDNTTFFRP